jgi:hypothetical protein
MTHDEVGIIVSRLVPGMRYSGCFTDNTQVWLDDRPFPSQEDIEAEYVVWLAEQAKAETIKQAHAEYYAATEAGYIDANGITWYCNERATMDLAMMVVLNTLDETEPVYIMSMSHGVQELTYIQFKALAVEIGRHAYGLRHNLWGAILSA